MKFTEKIHWKIWIEFFLLSSVSLFLELLIIRWMSSEIRVFSVFKTFPLVACFIGLGSGYALAKNEFFKNTTWTLLFFAAAIKLADFTQISVLPFPTFGLAVSQNIMMNQNDVLLRLGIFCIALPILVLAPFLLMLCLGARLGLLFNEFNPLPAYCVNIGGAIFGGLIFSVLSFNGLSPGILILVPGLIIVWYISSIDKKHLIIGSLAVLISAFLAANPNPTAYGASVYWSPYQRIDLFPIMAESKTADKHIIKFGDFLDVNRTLQQGIVNWQVLDNNSDLIDPKYVKPIRSWERRFAFPFTLRKPQDVLIVGSGLGNDVAEALKNNVSTVDAVEIDPVIIKLGRSYHYYDSPKVKVICNDARNFLITAINTMT